MIIIGIRENAHAIVRPYGLANGKVIILIIITAIAIAIAHSKSQSI